MKVQMLLVCMAIWLGCTRSGSSTLDKMSSEKINEIMSHVDENDPLFTKKDVSFDSIHTYAGMRSLPSGRSQRIKLKLYYYGDRARGYYNLADQDEKNLQVFAKKVGDLWALTCVTKLNMEEVGGYVIWTTPQKGIWSNGHHDFQKGSLSMTKQNIDYNELTSW